MFFFSKVVDARHILLKIFCFLGEGGRERGGGGDCLCRGVGLTSQSSKAGSPSGRAVKDKIKQSDSQTTPGAGALRWLVVELPRVLVKTHPIH